MSGWIPAFLLGVASMVVLETGLGLLLFVSPGLLPALTGLLAVALGSYAVGLASVRGGAAQGGVSRWPWFVAALSLIVAAVLSLGWSFQGVSVPETAMGRGTQMALILALPLYGLGACLGVVAQRGTSDRALDPGSALPGGRPSDRFGDRTGAAVAAGGAVGVSVLGVFLLPRFEPFSVYLFCVMCVALAALGLAGARGRGLGAAPARGGADPWALETFDS